LSTNARILGEAANGAVFTNAYEDVSPTGIVMDNLPYLLLLLLAAAGLGGYVAARARRHARQTA
jgi:hypothetical protein